MSSLILLCAATSVEAKACKQGIARSGESARYEILQTGMGMVQARLTLEKRLSQSNLAKPAQVISTGFAGSWTRALQVGSWIQAMSVETRDSSSPANPIPIDLNKTAIAGKLSFELHPACVLTIDQADTQGETPRSDSSLPLAVDMESYAWAEICQARGIPFQIIRMISDNPDAPLPDSIGSFAAIATSSTVQEKFRSLTRGLTQAMQEPKNLAGFIARGTKLPGLLSKGWQEIASKQA